MGDDGYSEKRRRSWREIDQMRDGSRRSSSHREKKQSKAAKSAAYERYKQQVEEFFSGGAVPDALKAELGDVRAGGIFPLIGAIKKAQTPSEIATAVQRLLEEGYEIPGSDGELLVKLLEHPEEQMQKRAAILLDEFLSAGNPCPKPALTRQRLELISVMAEDEELAELAEELRDKV